MRMMKWALLGGAALAVTASGAYADDLAALKAELEALKSRVHELEAKPAPAQLPEGLSFLSIRKGSDVVAPMAERRDDRIEQGHGLTLSVLPAADAAPTTEVTVQGEVRTDLFYVDDDFDWTPNNIHPEIHFDALDVQARARLNVTGKTETAVGEVGVFLRVQGGTGLAGSDAFFDKGYGWWRITPVWTLTAGFLDNTSAIQAGVDWDFTRVGFVGFFGPTNATVEQMRLSYNDRNENGPFSAAIAVEESETGTSVGPYAGSVAVADQSDLPGVAGYLKYDGDNVMFQVTGHVEDDDFGNDTDWFIGAGTRLGLGDMFTFTAAGMFGEGYGRNAGYFFHGDLAAITVPIGGDDEYWAASAGFVAKLADDISVEVGGAYGEVDADFGGVDSAWGVIGGLYWTPVSQLKLGWTAIYSEADGPENNNVHSWDAETFGAAFTTWMSF